MYNLVSTDEFGFQTVYFRLSFIEWNLFGISH